MDTSLILLLTVLPTFAIGGAMGATIAYLYCKARVATLEAEHAADLEKIEWIRDSQEVLRETFCSGPQILACPDCVTAYR
jgi:hypothetical protein